MLDTAHGHDPGKGAEGSITWVQYSVSGVAQSYRASVAELRHKWRMVPRHSHALEQYERLLVKAYGQHSHGKRINLAGRWHYLQGR